MVISTELNSKTMFEKKKKRIKNKWNVIYFGAMFFEVQAWIFVELINLQLYGVFQNAFISVSRNR